MQPVPPVHVKAPNITGKIWTNQEFAVFRPAEKHSGQGYWHSKKILGLIKKKFAFSKKTLLL